MMQRVRWVSALIATIVVILLIGGWVLSGAPLTANSTSATGSPVPTPPSRGSAQIGSVRAVVERVKPAVVQITSEQVMQDQLGQPTTGTGVGSGVIYDARGLILTNDHVVEGAQSLLVTLPDGRTYPGTLLGGDPETDLAVVKVGPKAGESLPTAALGNSAALGVGDQVVAIGNALALPGGPTVTAGVVSAVGRAIQEPGDTAGEPGPYLYDLIQTDAAINPGNSGGPLVNMAGEVIGINTLAAGDSGDSSGVMAQGIGFAIAINTARPIADQLASGKPVLHPYLGIAYGLVTPALATSLDLPVKQGVVISQVAPNSPAAKAGLSARDVITAVDDQPIVDETTLGQALNQHKPGEQVQLSIARGTQRLTITVTLGEKPAS